jgi:SAM-dependent methyltransferase
MSHEADPVVSQEPSASQRYYDELNRRLVYIGKSATPEMWDALWASNHDSVRQALTPGRGTRWVVNLTKRYLPAGARVLEGGCGQGHNVAALRRAGYDCVGIDFAAETVSLIKRFAPKFPVMLGDLRSVPFLDSAFDGYWSLGVIEHFFYGYDSLAAEMTRVIRPDGFLFLTFPYMSPLRRLKAAISQYRTDLPLNREPAGFYQFALDATSVVDAFARRGFVKRHQTRMSGLKGFKDEIGRFGGPLEKLEAYPGRSVPLRGLRFMTEGLAWVGAAHSCVLVLQKVRT